MTHQRRPWSPADDAMLRALYPSNDISSLMAALQRSRAAIKNRADKLQLRKADGHRNTGQFLAGGRPWNSGLKGWQAGGRSHEFQFKKGQKPHTWHPIGHERITDEGYLQRKITDTGVTRRDYVNVHWLVWFAAGREIPTGHVLVFKDRNKRNIELNNLELITRAENMRRNSYHTNYPKEVAQLIQLRGALNRQINKRHRQSQEATA